jgi:hypothetical protein
MKSVLRTVVACAGLLAATAPSAWAQSACPCGAGTRVVGKELVSLLAGKTVCGAVDGDTWQEFHSGSGAGGGPLIDYKRGPGDPVDPSKQVGTWAIAEVETVNSFVVYDYGGGNSYGYAVCTNGGSVNFCGASPASRSTQMRSTPGRNVLNATLVTGQVPCPAARAGVRR